MAVFKSTPAVLSWLCLEARPLKRFRHFVLFMSNSCPFLGFEVSFVFSNTGLIFNTELAMGREYKARSYLIFLCISSFSSKLLYIWMDGSIG